jgi:uncharacterized YigZ family protein
VSSLFSDTYNEIEAEKEFNLREKGSKFFAFSYLVRNEEEVKSKIQYLKSKYLDASHYCYAFVLGQGQEAQRANDDGEPSNSAGRAILRAMLSLELTNVLVVVVRYFGGTLLGIPGLIQAYGDAAKGVLVLSGNSEKLQEDEFDISADFEHEQIIQRLLRPFENRIVDRSYTDKVYYRVAIRRNQTVHFEKEAVEQYQLEVQAV